MINIFRFVVLAGSLLLPPAAAHAEWRAVEQVQSYAITGSTPGELYASIGERGPAVGIGTRTIALTNFKLTWRRDYQPRNGACVLASAVPKLIITYSLPKPAAKLPPETRQRWEVFIAGVQAHERVHGEHIKEMVAKIEAASVGLTVADDPKCTKIRTQLQQRLGELSQEQRRRSRDFDRVELGEGGNIHHMILRLVNG